MSRQPINLGSTANDGTGDKLRTAFTKIENNFVEVYSNVAVAHVHANSSYDVANAAFGAANNFNTSRLSNSGFNLSLTDNGTINFSANGYIYNRPNSSGDGYGFDTLEIFPDNRYPQGLIIDPTYANHIHLRGTGTQDESITDLFIGGEVSHFRIPSGLNPYPIITSNNQSWLFYDDGSLQFPDSTQQYTAYSNVVFETANAAFGKANNFIVSIPTTSKGQAGDLQGMFSANDTYLYYCSSTYTDGLSDIWKRINWSADTW